MTGYTVDCLALLLVITACLGRIWCSAFIGGYKSASLITNGPYSVARHPLYSFSWIGAVGLGVATHSIVLTLVTSAFFAAVFSFSARREDDFLSRAHPDHFAAYARSTRRFWPRWRNYRVAESITIKPVILKKSFLDAGAFVLLYLVIDTLRVLRETGVLPTLCKIP
jgi:isoprenylcysteine carboxyl methyltransferase (ICMT) family protein YpbQ